MSSADFREPTNDELWAQPPTGVPQRPAPHAVTPVPQPPLPMPVHHAPPPAVQQRPDRTAFVLAIVSMALGIPLSAIASGTAGLPGLLVAWVGIVLVNVVYSWSHRNGPRP
nr:hypothetical protein [Propionicimonas sp.]